jgi:hypothetical protein
MANNKCKYCRQITKTTSIDRWEPLGWCVAYVCQKCDYEWLDTEYHNSEEVAIFKSKVMAGR